jgi:hypothetical protein
MGLPVNFMFVFVVRIFATADNAVYRIRFHNRQMFLCTTSEHRGSEENFYGFFVGL